MNGPYDYDYGRAEADLEDSGCPDPEEIYEYRSKKGFDDFMRENNLDPDNYRNGGSGSSSSSDSDPCFLTTACTAARDLPDDCDELTTLRRYRDEYLRKRDGGEADIARYYETAPKIVDAVNALEEKDAIWNFVYELLVVPCVNLIKKERYEDAYSVYSGFVIALENRFLN